MRFLLPPVSSPAAMYTAFKPLADYLGKALGEPVELSFSHDLNSFYHEASKEKAQITFFCPISYIEVAHETAYYPLAGVVPAPGGDRSVIVVRRDSAIHTVLDLRGHSFVLGNPACAASSLVPLSLLRDAGIRIQDFSMFRHGESDSAALMDVAARFYDATAVAANVAAPYIQAGTMKVIGSAPPSPGDVIAASGMVPAAARARLRAALLSVKSQDPQAIRALAFLVRGFRPVQDNDYEILRILYRDLYKKDLAPKVRDEGLTLAVPPSFGPMTAYQIFAPLQAAIAQATGQPVRLLVPSSESRFMAEAQEGDFDFSLQPPPMYHRLQDRMEAIALATPATTGRNVVLISSAMKPLQSTAVRPPMTVAYASPYCSSYKTAVSYLTDGDKGRRFSWLPSGSESAILKAVAEGKAQVGVVRQATIDAHAAFLPHTWHIVTAIGSASPWYLAANRRLSPRIVEPVVRAVRHLSSPSLAKAGFGGFVTLRHGP